MPADDQISLFKETNRRFWEQTRYKPGQKLDVNDPTDRKMSKIWMDVYAVVRGYRERATVFAKKLAAELRYPLVFVSVKPDGTTNGSVFDSRNRLDAQYDWAIDQPEMYAYIAAFDVSKSNAPLRDQFSTSPRRPKVDARAQEALSALREQAKGVADRSSAQLLGVALRPSGQWYTPSFSSAAEAVAWLGNVKKHPTWFTYAAVFDKTGTRWPAASAEAIGHGRPPLPVA